MSKPAPVKIQINSLEALERLLGGSTELEVELRQCVAVEFARRYLKPIAETPVFTEAIKELQKNIDKAIDREVVNFFGKYKNSWSKDIELNDTIKAMIRSFAVTVSESACRAEVTKIVDEKMSKILEEALSNINADKFLSMVIEKAVVTAKRELVRKIQGEDK